MSYIWLTCNRFKHNFKNTSVSTTGAWKTTHYLSCQHLVQKNSIGPPVHWFPIGLVCYNLKVMRKENIFKKWNNCEGMKQQHPCCQNPFLTCLYSVTAARLCAAKGDDCSVVLYATKGRHSERIREKWTSKSTAIKHIQLFRASITKAFSPTIQFAIPQLPPTHRLHTRNDNHGDAKATR